MKAKVLVEFRDKYTGKIHTKDKIITISKDRYAEILSVGKFVEEIKEKKQGVAYAMPCFFIRRKYYG